MILSIDKIVHGNPCARDYSLMQKETYLDRLIPELQAFPPPKNSSQATRAELHSLVEFAQTKRVVQNNLYDETLLHHIKKMFVDAGADPVEIDTITHSIAEDVIPLITKLKYYFNRPRPSQLSYYFNVNLYSDFSYFTNNPSYPSGHTCLTAITGEVLGNLYPQSYKHMQLLIKDVLTSRLYLAVHYPSDNDMSMVVARKVLSDGQFKANYRL